MPGIKTTREYYGEQHEVVDYCGLRDSLVHPSQWYERFGITKYIYYTVSFDSRIPPEPNSKGLLSGKLLHNRGDQVPVI